MAVLDFLVELGTAELPPKSLSSLSKAFTEGFVRGLKAELGKDADKLLADTKIESFATPRRIAIRMTRLLTQIPGSKTVIQGPPIAICYDGEGAPTNALKGFAKKNSAQLSELCTVNGKVSYTKEVAPKALDALLPNLVEQSLSKLPIAKKMRWGASKLEFVRPVQWLVMLFGKQLINCEILGVTSGSKSRGHRFHHSADIEIQSPCQYEEKLHAAFVIASFNKRKQIIREQVEAQAKLINGVPHIEEDLLEEVTGLNEWPVALTGSFEEEYLSVPQEALILSMKEHQKYFYTTDELGKLMPNFITVSNIESKDPDKVINGNEKVIRPRLADAKFFFESDKKISLQARCEKLKQIVFQQQLGSVYEKSERNSKLAAHISRLIGADEGKAKRAALLAKADLITDMVFEFTDLQGLMGYHYALNDGEDMEVAHAINEQYLPKFAGDSLPETQTGITLALADRLDTLTGMFGIGQPPTGSKDPFALRRATLGVLRIIIEKQLDVDLQELVCLAVDQHLVIEVGNRAKVTAQVVDFMLDRLRAYYDDRQIRVDTYLAVAALKPTKPLDFDLRVNAVEHFRGLEAAQSLAAANKRLSNILAKQQVCASATIDTRLLLEPAERELHQKLVILSTQLTPLFDAADYRAALTLLSTLQESIDAFFDSVMVMVEDQAVQQNRVLILRDLRLLFLRIADISLLN